MVALEVGGGGEHDIGKGGSRRHEDFADNEQVQLLEGGGHCRRIGIANRRIVADDDHSLHGIWLLRENGAKYRWWVRKDRRPHGQRLEAIGAEALRRLLRRG